MGGKGPERKRSCWPIHALCPHPGMFIFKNPVQCIIRLHTVLVLIKEESILCKLLCLKLRILIAFLNIKNLIVIMYYNSDLNCRSVGPHASMDRTTYRLGRTQIPLPPKTVQWGLNLLRILHRILAECWENRKLGGWWDATEYPGKRHAE